MVSKPAKKSPPRKAQPRKAASRRAARPRAAGATSGDPVSVNDTGVAPAPVASAGDGQVRESAQPQDNSGTVQQPPYGGLPTYVFFPQLDTKDEALLAPIVFPKFSTVNAPRKWLWRVYDKGPLIQAFEWMKLAGIPRDLQERVVDLPDEEYERFWDGWFGEARASQGE